MLTRFKPAILQPQVQKNNLASTCNKVSSNVQKHVEPEYDVAEIQEKMTDQVMEICELRKKINSEKLKRIALEKQISEMKEFIEEYGLKDFVQNNPDCIEFLDGVKDLNEFTTQIAKLNNQVFGKSKRFYKEGNAIKTKDDTPIILELLHKGFKVNDGPFRKYSNPLNAKFLATLNKGIYAPELYDYGEEMRVIEVVSSINLPDTFISSGRKIKSQDDDNVFEPLPDPNPIGDGPGTIKLRFPSGAEQIIKVTKETTIREIISLLNSTIGFTNYSLTTTMSNTLLDEDVCINDIHLYPRGILLAVYHSHE